MAIFSQTKQRSFRRRGTAGSANIGKRYAMFEAIHGSAPRMVKRAELNMQILTSIIRAGAMLLDHVGFKGRADRLHGT